uniref:Uncharacterized protein n=1 Tax=Anguilla anguilla TaxID=7936 RepID=A0A0E9TAD6_ANGAN
MPLRMRVTQPSKSHLGHICV